MHSSTVVRLAFLSLTWDFILKSASIKLSHKINLNVNITILKENKDTNGPKGPAHQGKHWMAFIIWCLILKTKQKLQSQIWLLRQHKEVLTIPITNNPLRAKLCCVKPNHNQSHQHLLSFSATVKIRNIKIWSQNSNTLSSPLLLSRATQIQPKYRLTELTLCKPCTKSYCLAMLQL